MHRLFFKWVWCKLLICFIATSSSCVKTWGKGFFAFPIRQRTPPSTFYVRIATLRTGSGCMVSMPPHRHPFTLSLQPTHILSRHTIRDYVCNPHRCLLSIEPSWRKRNFLEGFLLLPGDSFHRSVFLKAFDVWNFNTCVKLLFTYFKKFLHRLESWGNLIPRGWTMPLFNYDKYWFYEALYFSITLLTFQILGFW